MRYYTALELTREMYAIKTRGEHEKIYEVLHLEVARVPRHDLVRAAG